MEKPALKKVKKVKNLTNENITILENLLSKIEVVNDTQTVKELLTFVQDFKHKEMDKQYQYKKEEEELKKSKQERLITLYREITSIILGITLVTIGTIFFLYTNKEFGVFFIGVGSVALGLSSNLVKSFAEIFSK